MNPLSLEEIKAKEKILYPNRGVDKVMSKEKVKSESKNSIVNEKECRGCHEIKKFSEYKKSSNGRYGHASRCNSCVKIDEDKAIHKLSETIIKELPKIPESKEEFTIEYVSNRLKASKSKTSQALKKLDEDGILTHIYKARTKYYSIAKTEPAKSSFEDLADNLPESKPKFELKVGSGNSLEKAQEASKDAINDVIEETANEIIKEPITQEDLNRFEKYGIESYPLVEPTPEQTILNIVDIAYKNAESIEINPQTHELKIKMKG